MNSVTIKPRAINFIQSPRYGIDPDSEPHESDGEMELYPVVYLNVVLIMEESRQHQKEILGEIFGLGGYVLRERRRLGKRRRQYGLSFDRLWGPSSPFLECFCFDDLVSFEKLVQSLDSRVGR